MYRVLRLALLSSTVALSACAIHPLPENVTPFNTLAIVNKIRCEARAAVMYAAYEYLADEGVTGFHKDPSLSELEHLLREGLDKTLKPETLKQIEKYSKAGLSMEFGLRMAEVNSLYGDTSVTRLFAGGADLLGFNATNKRTRQNFRNFRITQTWDDLARGLADKCTHDVDYRGQNPLYPIAGEIGLREMISTYANLNEDSKLAKASRNNVSEDAFVDELTFTTTFSAKFDPGFSVTAPAGRNFLIKSVGGGGGFGAERTDEHQLIVAAYIPKESKKVSPRQRAQSLVLPKRIESGHTLTEPERVASEAIDRQLTKRFFFGINPLSTFRDLQP